jgi:hypothetical protein
VGDVRTMSDASATVTRGARAMQAAAVCWLVVWQVAAVAGLGRRVGVALGLFGFVFTFAFGKAYSLVPSYFDRKLVLPLAPLFHAPLAVVGVAGLSLGRTEYAPQVVADAGAVCWGAGAFVFLAAMARTVRDNPLGRETGTGDHNARRRRVDRAAFAYVLAGTYETVAMAVDGLPLLLGRGTAATSHLLAAGGAALLLFAVGARLLPRFLVAHPPYPLVVGVLAAGTLGPVVLARSLYVDPWFAVGAVLEAAAVVGFAATYGLLWYRSDRDRVAFVGVGLAMLAGVAGVSFGLHFATAGVDAALVPAHYRLTLLGFLGLSIVGVAYQFYPPTVGTFPGAGERTAWVSYLGFAGGLAVEVAGVVADASGIAVGSEVALAGRALALGGALAFAWLLLGVFVQRSSLLG